MYIACACMVRILFLFQGRKAFYEEVGLYQVRNILYQTTTTKLSSSHHLIMWQLLDNNIADFSISYEAQTATKKSFRMSNV